MPVHSPTRGLPRLSQAGAENRRRRPQTAPTKPRGDLSLDALRDITHDLKERPRVVPASSANFSGSSSPRYVDAGYIYDAGDLAAAWEEPLHRSKDAVAQSKDVVAAFAELWARIHEGEVQVESAMQQLYEEQRAHTYTKEELLQLKASLAASAEARRVADRAAAALQKRADAAEARYEDAKRCLEATVDATEASQVAEEVCAETARELEEHAMHVATKTDAAGRAGHQLATTQDVDVAALQAELYELHDEREKNRNTLEEAAWKAAEALEVQQRLDDTLSCLAEARKKLSNASQALLKREGHIAELRVLLAERDSQNAELQRAAEAAEKREVELWKEIDHLRKRNDELMQERAEAQEAQSTSFDLDTEAKMREVTVENARLTEELVQLKAEAETLREQLCMKEEGDQRALADKDTLVARLQAHLEEMRQHCCDEQHLRHIAEEKVEALQEQLYQQMEDDARKAELAEAESAALRAKLAGLQQQDEVGSQREGELATLRKELADLHRQHRASESELADLRTKLADLQKQCEASSQCEAALRAELAELHQQHAASSQSEAELAALRMELAELHRQREASDQSGADLAALRAELADLQQQREASEQLARVRLQAHEEAQAELAALRNELANLHQQREADEQLAKTHLNAQEDELAALRAQLADLQVQRDNQTCALLKQLADAQSQDDLAALRAQLLDAQRQRELETASLREQLAMLEQHIQEDVEDERDRPSRRLPSIVAREEAAEGLTAAHLAQALCEREKLKVELRQLLSRTLISEELLLKAQIFGAWALLAESAKLRSFALDKVARHVLSHVHDSLLADVCGMWKKCVEDARRKKASQERGTAKAMLMMAKSNAFVKALISKAWADEVYKTKERGRKVQAFEKHFGLSDVAAQCSVFSAWRSISYTERRTRGVKERCMKMVQQLGLSEPAIQLSLLSKWHRTAHAERSKRSTKEQCMKTAATKAHQYADLLKLRIFSDWFHLVRAAVIEKLQASTLKFQAAANEAQAKLEADMARLRSELLESHSALHAADASTVPLLEYKLLCEQHEKAVNEHRATKEELESKMGEVKSAKQDLKSAQEELESAKQELESAKAEMVRLSSDRQAADLLAAASRKQKTGLASAVVTQLTSAEELSLQQFVLHVWTVWRHQLQKAHHNRKRTGLASAVVTRLEVGEELSNQHFVLHRWRQYVHSTLVGREQRQACAQQTWAAASHNLLIQLLHTWARTATATRNTARVMHGLQVQHHVQSRDLCAKMLNAWSGVASDLNTRRYSKEIYFQTLSRHVSARTRLDLATYLLEWKIAILQDQKSKEAGAGEMSLQEREAEERRLQQELKNVQRLHKEALSDVQRLQDELSSALANAQTESERLQDELDESQKRQHELLLKVEELQQQCMAACASAGSEGLARMAHQRVLRALDKNFVAQYEAFLLQYLTHWRGMCLLRRRKQRLLQIGAGIIAKSNFFVKVDMFDAWSKFATGSRTRKCSKYSGMSRASGMIRSYSAWLCHEVLANWLFVTVRARQLRKAKDSGMTKAIRMTVARSVSALRVCMESWVKMHLHSQRKEKNYQRASRMIASHAASLNDFLQARCFEAWAKAWGRIKNSANLKEQNTAKALRMIANSDAVLLNLMLGLWTNHVHTATARRKKSEAIEKCLPSAGELLQFRVFASWRSIVGHAAKLQLEDSLQNAGALAGDHQDALRKLREEISEKALLLEAGKAACAAAEDALKASEQESEKLRADCSEMQRQVSELQSRVAELDRFSAEGQAAAQLRDQLQEQLRRRAEHSRMLSHASLGRQILLLNQAMLDEVLQIWRRELLQEKLRRRAQHSHSLSCAALARQCSLLDQADQSEVFQTWRFAVYEKSQVKLREQLQEELNRRAEYSRSLSNASLVRQIVLLDAALQDEAFQIWRRELLQEKSRRQAQHGRSLSYVVLERQVFLLDQAIQKEVLQAWRSSADDAVARHARKEQSFACAERCIETASQRLLTKYVHLWRWFVSSRNHLKSLTRGLEAQLDNQERRGCSKLLSEWHATAVEMCKRRNQKDGHLASVTRSIQACEVAYLALYVLSWSMVALQAKTSNQAENAALQEEMRAAKEDSDRLRAELLNAEGRIEDLQRQLVENSQAARAEFENELAAQRAELEKMADLRAELEKTRQENMQRKAATLLTLQRQAFTEDLTMVRTIVKCWRQNVEESRELHMQKYRNVVQTRRYASAMVLRVLTLYLHLWSRVNKTRTHAERLMKGMEAQLFLSGKELVGKVIVLWRGAASELAVQRQKRRHHVNSVQRYLVQTCDEATLNLYFLSWSVVTRRAAEQDEMTEQDAERRQRELAMRNTLCNAEADKGRILAELERAHQNLDRARDEACQLQVKLADSQKQQLELVDQFEGMRRQHIRFEGEIAMYKEREGLFKDAVEMSRQATARLVAAEERYGQVQSELEDARRLRDDFQRERDEVKKQLRDAEIALERLRVQDARDVHDVEGRLKEMLGVATQTFERQQTEEATLIGWLRRERDDSRSRLEQAERYCSELNEALRKRDQQLMKLTAELSELKSHIRKGSLKRSRDTFSTQANMALLGLCFRSWISLILRPLNAGSPTVPEDESCLDSLDHWQYTTPTSISPTSGMWQDSDNTSVHHTPQRPTSPRSAAPGRARSLNLGRTPGSALPISPRPGSALTGSARPGSALSARASTASRFGRGKLIQQLVDVSRWSGSEAASAVSTRCGTPEMRGTVLGAIPGSFGPPSSALSMRPSTAGPVVRPGAGRSGGSRGSH